MRQPAPAPGQPLWTWLIGGGIILQAVYRLIRPISAAEFEWLHAGWMIGEGLLPYRDFPLVHPPALAVLAAPLVGLLGHHPTVLLAAIRLLTLLLALWIARGTWRLAAMHLPAGAGAAAPAVALLLLGSWTFLDSATPMTGVAVATGLSLEGLLRARQGRLLGAGLLSGLSLFFYQSPVPLAAPMLDALLTARKAAWRLALGAALAALPAVLLIPYGSVVTPHFAWFPTSPWTSAVRVLLVQDAAFWWLGLAALLYLARRRPAPYLGWVAATAAAWAVVLLAPKALPHHLLPAVPLLAAAAGSAWIEENRSRYYAWLAAAGVVLVMLQVWMGDTRGWREQAAAISRVQALTRPTAAVLSGNGMAYNRPHVQTPWFLPPSGAGTYAALADLPVSLAEREVAVVLMDEHLARIMTVPVEDRMAIGTRILTPELAVAERERLESARRELVTYLDGHYLFDYALGVGTAGCRLRSTDQAPAGCRLIASGQYQVEGPPGVELDGVPVSGTVEISSGVYSVRSTGGRGAVVIRYVGPAGAEPTTFRVSRP